MMDIAKYIIITAFLFFIAGCSVDKPREIVLFDFETDAALDQIHWECKTLFSLSGAHAAHGKKSLKAELFPSPWPGFAPPLKHHDWRGFKTFAFSVYNPGDKSLKLVVRIDDKKDAIQYNERYNKGFDIAPGWNRLEIPLETLKTSNTNQPLNLKKIYRFLVFMSHPDKKHVLYLDYFRLI